MLKQTITQISGEMRCFGRKPGLLLHYMFGIIIGFSLSYVILTGQLTNINTRREAHIAGFKDYKNSHYRATTNELVHEHESDFHSARNVPTMHSPIEGRNNGPNEYTAASDTHKSTSPIVWFPAANHLVWLHQSTF